MAVAGRASGGLMGRGGCGAVLLSGHSLASVSAEPAPHMSVGLVESEEAWAAHSTVPGPEPPALLPATCSWEGPGASVTPAFA